MKLPLCCGLLLLAAGALAQTPAGTNDRAAATAPRQRAPLANVEDLEPAVDVGGGRQIAAVTPTAPAAPASAAQSPPPAAPPVGQREQTQRPRVMDSLDLGTTSITGNQELPKVLVIVPWKKSDLGDLVGRPVNTLLDEVLAPIDPDVFQRHLEYYETLHGGSEKE
jgi:hypothetical protein